MKLKVRTLEVAKIVVIKNKVAKLELISRELVVRKKEVSNILSHGL